MDQPLESVHLDQESEHRLTHYLVIPSHFNESLNILRVEHSPFVHSLNEDLLGSWFLLGIVLGNGNTEMSKQRTYLKEISGSCCRAKD